MSKSKQPRRFNVYKTLRQHFSTKQLVLIGIVMIVLTSGASAATIARVSNSRAKDEQNRVLRTANIQEAKDDPESKTAAVTKTESTAPVTSPVATPTSTPSTKKTVKFVKGGASLQGSTVVVSLTADGDLNGNCYYSFALGNSSVKQSNAVGSGRTCAINIPLSSFVKSGNWYFTLSYASKDGLTTGSGGGFEVAIVPEVRSISFTKGGAGMNDSVVTAGSNLSEIQSGTCTFTFMLNGTVRVTKTITITNSNRCSIDIPLSEFPKSAVYDYALAFVSNDTLTIANQSVFPVEVF